MPTVWQNTKKPRRASLLTGYRAVFALYAIPNLALAAITFLYNGQQGGPIDWTLWQKVVPRLGLASAALFGTTGDYAYIYSPIMAWLLVAIVPLGYGVFAALHGAVLGLLRERRLIALALVSWGFWADVAFGNFMVFVFVAAALALRGSRGGAIAYLALFVLMPRPIEAPLALWLLWRRPDTRWPFAALAGATAVVVILGGYAGPWFAALTDMAAGNGQWMWNVGPTRLLGNGWLLAGVPLAAILTYRGRPALAGLALSPYVLPQYLLFALLELGHLAEEDHLERRDRVRVVLDVPAIRDGLDEALDVVAT